MERAKGKDGKILRTITPGNSVARQDVDCIRAIYERYGVIDEARAEVTKRTMKAQKALGIIPSSRAKKMLLWVSEQLLKRNS